MKKKANPSFSLSKMPQRFFDIEIESHTAANINILLYFLRPIYITDLKHPSRISLFHLSYIPLLAVSEDIPF